MQQKKPKVSICVLTYNQEKYIRQCLQSILDQKTNFEFEIIVGDDCSIDKTKEIIKEIAEEHPNIIRPILHNINIGATKNYISIHSAAIGEYVAHCDGDDYWYPGKLQYQADLLDAMPDISQCWGCADIVNDAGEKIAIFPSRLARILYPKYIQAKDIALSYALVGQHSTQMYKRKYQSKLNSDKPVLDYWIAFNMALHGPAYYDKKIVGAYRVTSSPSVTRNQNNKKAAVDVLSAHVVEIASSLPALGDYAKANLITRYLFSKMRGHDLSACLNALEAMKNVKNKYILIAKSAYFFALQKIG